MTNQTSLKPVLFLAFANDKESGNRYLRLLDTEANRLRDALETADAPFEVVVRQGIDIDGIFKVFQAAKYRHRIAIFHFGGHANSYQLLFESKTGQPIKMDTAGFAKFLSQQHGLQLVFLNGCETQGQVQGLLEAGIPAVIATGRKIMDDVAVQFAERFYKGLLTDQPLPKAFIEAEGAIQSKLGSDFRSAYRAELDEEDFTLEERNTWPWQLHPTERSPEISNWSLSKLAQDPYFGLPPLPRQRQLPQKPFRGLSYFTEKEAALFFGRGWQIRTLFQLITKAELSTNPIILLYGQSGVGKSSLLAAGLLPRLKQVAAVRYIRREDAGDNLTSALGQALQNRPPNPPEGGMTDFTHPSGGPGGRSNLWSSQETEDRPLTIILDQVEELYTRPGDNPAREIADFLDTLETIFNDDLDQWPQGKLILGFRKEWLAEIRDRLTERKLPYKEMFLKHLDRPGIIEAISGPAIAPRLRTQYELEVTEELPIVIADDLLADRGSAIAPTLQIILTKLWENATGQPKVFDRELYDNLRLDSANFLGQLLDQQLAELAQDHPTASSSGLVLDILAYHTTELGTTQQRSHQELVAAYRHQTDLLPRLVQSYKDRYLLVDPSGAEDEEAPDATRLSHDTLGPLVRARFDVSDKPGQRAARVLQNRVTDWRNGDEGTPLDEEDLTTVEEGQPGMWAWDEDEVRLVAVSREVRGKRERNRKILGAVGAAAVALIALLAVVASWQWGQALEAQATAEAEAIRADDAAATAKAEATRADAQAATAETEATRADEAAATAEAEAERAQRRANIAQAQALSIASQQITPGYPLHALLAREAYNITGESEPEVYSLLDATLRVARNAPFRTILDTPEDRVWTVAFSGDNRWLAAGSGNSNVYLWSLADPEAEPRRLDAPADEVSPADEFLTVAFSGDNRWLAVGSGDSNVY
ncbi:MAG: CHAT domain-containing protein, partial [Chloroflexota bacterium]